MNFQTTKTSKIYGRLAYLGLAFAVALFYDIFLYDAHLGLGFFLFVSLYLISFTSLAVATNQLHQKWALWLIVPILVMSLDVVLFNNGLVSNFVPDFVALLLFLFSVIITIKNPHKFSFSLAKIPLIRQFEQPFVKWSHMFRDLFVSRETKNSRLYKNIAIALVIAAPILLIFGSLFASADAVFAEWVYHIFDFDISLEFAWRIFRTFAFTLLIGGFFYTLIDPKYLLREKIAKVFKIDSVISTTILLLVNILFLIFVIIQINYFFGAEEFVVRNGLTYAEYARSGFFQLTWVIGLAALMLIFFYRSAVHHGSGFFLKFLKIFLIFQVCVVAISALSRMNLYQDQFGYTILRLYVEWFIYFSMLILLISAVSIAINWKFRNFFYTSAVFGLVALSIVTSVNVDKMNAKENVDRYINDGKELDMGYLIYHLSIDAAPEVKRAFDAGYVYKGNNNDLHYDANTFQKVYLSDQRNVHKRLKDEDKNYQNFSDIKQNWKEFNFGVENLRDL